MKRMTQYSVLGISFVLSFIQLASLTNTTKVNAVTANDWNASRIIDDEVFFNPHSMSSHDIQNFLNAKMPSCDTNGERMYNSTQTRAQWTAANGQPQPPYTCLKDFTQNIPGISPDSYCGGSVGAGTKSAATIIKDVAVACNINPQVILVTLQKEQSLITDDWPWPVQYTKATGMGCPDTSLGVDVDANQNGCYDEYEGFFKQIYYGARQFQRYVKQPDVFNYAKGRNSYIAYQANNSSCGGTYITPETHATAALYNYTPYQPNAAALNNLYGTGDACSAYGNRNFWRMYSDWFGSTREYYTWSVIAQNAYTDSTKQTPANLGTLQSNKKYFVTVTIQNTGNVTWHKLGDTPTALGTTGPRDRLNSAFCDETWLACNRPALLHEYTVSPGQYGSFEFWITAPPEPGNFNEIFAPLVENLTWMDSHTISFPMSVPAVYSWTPETQYAYTDNSKTTPVDLSSLSAGQKVFIGFKAKNTGNTSWPNGGNNPVRAATLGHRDRLSSFCDTTWLGCNRPADMQEVLVAPGQVGTFEFWYKAPSAGFIGYEQFGLMSEGYLWMNDPGMSFYTNAPKEVYSWSPFTQYAYTDASKTVPVDLTTLKVGQKVYVGFQATNTGNTTWLNTGANQIRVGTTGARDRMSNFCDDSWLGCNRSSSLKELSVAPGQTGTFEFWYRAPNTSFIGFEQFSLMIEGSLWMNDPGMSFYTKVQ